jgi:uncharacterized protein YeaO (DUF488 family)
MEDQKNPEQTDKSVAEQLKPYQFKKGQSGNPLGRPKGSLSVIGSIKQMFENDPEQFQEFINKYLKDPRNRQHIVEMIDGKPRGSETNVAVQVNTFTGSPEQNKELDEELINMGLCVKCLQKARKYMNL